MKIYPEYVHWLGMIQKQCTGYGGNYWHTIDTTGVPLFEYDW